MDEDDHVSSSYGGYAYVAREQSPSSNGGDSIGHNHTSPLMMEDSLSMYSFPLPSDVIWSPTPRQASPHPPLY